MRGYSPKLPLTLDPTDGFRLNRSMLEVVKQNLKMLVLTSPGERVMEPTFGVGLYNFLFELNTEHTRNDVRSRIAQQVKKYMPFVQIIEIYFAPSRGIDIDRNSFAVAIKYAVPSLGSIGVLDLKVS